jgi:hypothetical protein
MGCTLESHAQCLVWLECACSVLPSTHTLLHVQYCVLHRISTLQSIFGSYGNKAHGLIDAIAACTKLTSLTIELATDGDQDSDIVNNTSKYCYYCYHCTNTIFRPTARSSLNCSLSSGVTAITASRMPHMITIYLHVYKSDGW